MHAFSHNFIFSGLIVSTRKHRYAFKKRTSREDDPAKPAGWVGLAWYTADDGHMWESKCSLSGLHVRSEDVVTSIC